MQLTFYQRRELTKAIKSKLKHKGWNVKDLARETGYSDRTVYRIFDPTVSVSRDCIYEVTKILGISMEDIT
jgi:AraC-like DNA-binding protein